MAGLFAGMSLHAEPEVPDSGTKANAKSAPFDTIQPAYYILALNDPSQRLLDEGVLISRVLTTHGLEYKVGLLRKRVGLLRGSGRRLRTCHRPRRPPDRAPSPRAEL